LIYRLFRKMVLLLIATEGERHEDVNPIICITSDNLERWIMENLISNYYNSLVLFVLTPNRTLTGDYRICYNNNNESDDTLDENKFFVDDQQSSIDQLLLKINETYQSKMTKREIYK
jgi:hypothetical protein